MSIIFGLRDEEPDEHDHRDALVLSNKYLSGLMTTQHTYSHF